MDAKSALRVLDDHEVIQLGPLRNGAHVAELPENTRVTATDATVGGQRMREQDRMGLLGLLLTAASQHGLQPVDLLAIGFAHALQDEVGTRPAGQTNGDEVKTVSRRDDDSA
jgi:hypothetical protein